MYLFSISSWAQTDIPVQFFENANVEVLQFLWAKNTKPINLAGALRHKFAHGSIEEVRALYHLQPHHDQQKFSSSEIFLWAYSVPELRKMIRTNIRQIMLDAINDDDIEIVKLCACVCLRPEIQRREIKLEKSHMLELKHFIIDSLAPSDEVVAYIRSVI